MPEDKLTKLVAMELTNRNLSFTIVNKDSLEVMLDGNTLEVNLHNLRAKFNQDSREEHIIEFIDEVLDFHDMPPLDEIKSTIRLMLAANEALTEVEGIIYRQLTKELSMMVVYSYNEERQIRSVSEADIEEWDMTEEQLFELAESNMSLLMDEATVEVSDVQDMKLAMLSLHHVVFKASLILSPNFKKKLSEHIELPVFAVTPVRDFIYIFSCKDSELINMLGEVVIREFEKGPYALTTEILKIDADGISAIGKYG